MSETLKSGMKYFALTKDRKKMIRQAFVLFILLRLLMGRVALKKIISFLSPRKNSTRLEKNYCSVDDILWSVHAAARRVPSTTCLMNALVAEYLLKKSGVNSRIFIGVRKRSETELAAHAWVTVDNQIVIGEIEDIADYTPLPDSELLKL